MAMPHHSARLSIHPLPRRNTLEDTLTGLPGFLEPRIEATAAGRLNTYQIGTAAGTDTGIPSEFPERTRGVNMGLPPVLL